MLHFTLFHQPLQNSAKFRRNLEIREILRLGSKFCIRGILWSLFMGVTQYNWTVIYIIVMLQKILTHNTNPNPR